MDFSRTGKMSFTDYIYAIIQNTKFSLQVGLNAFLTHTKRKILNTLSKLSPKDASGLK